MDRRGAMSWMACAAAGGVLGCRRVQPASSKPAAAAGTPRIAAISPALAITLRDLGLAGSIVGRHAWDMALDLSVPIVGDQSSIDLEALLDVSPTHVLLEWGVREPPGRLRTLASERGWLVRSWSLLSYAQARASFGEIAAFVGQGQPEGEAIKVADRAAELTRALDQACTPVAEAARAGKILLLASANPAAALGPGSFHHEILGRLGATPAVVSGGAYIQLHLEDIKAMAPEAIVLIDPGDPRSPATSMPTGWDELTSRLRAIASLDVPAIRDRRVALIDDPLALTPSTALIGFAERLDRIIAGWAAG